MGVAPRTRSLPDTFGKAAEAGGAGAEAEKRARRGEQARSQSREDERGKGKGGCLLANRWVSVHNESRSSYQLSAWKGDQRCLHPCTQYGNSSPSVSSRWCPACMDIAARRWGGW